MQKCLFHPPARSVSPSISDISDISDLFEFRIEREVEKRGMFNQFFHVVRDVRKDVQSAPPR